MVQRPERQHGPGSQRSDVAHVRVARRVDGNDRQTERPARVLSCLRQRNVAVYAERGELRQHLLLPQIDDRNAELALRPRFVVLPPMDHQRSHRRVLRRAQVALVRQGAFPRLRRLQLLRRVRVVFRQIDRRRFRAVARGVAVGLRAVLLIASRRDDADGAVQVDRDGFRRLFRRVRARAALLLRLHGGGYGDAAGREDVRDGLGVVFLLYLLGARGRGVFRVTYAQRDGVRQVDDRIVAGRRCSALDVFDYRKAVVAFLHGDNVAVVVVVRVRDEDVEAFLFDLRRIGHRGSFLQHHPRLALGKTNPCRKKIILHGYV